MTRQQITTISFLALLFACGGSNGASTCAPEAEHSHDEAADEEECEPGKNCMCPGGGTGTSVCDVATEKFIECDCSKGMASAGGQTGATTTGTTMSAVTGAAGTTAAGASAAGSSSAAGAAGMTAAASSAAGSSGAAGASSAAAGAAGH